MRGRKQRGRPLDGRLIVDKPAGLTSTDVVNRVRRWFDAQKAGHGGTLDPLATGLLPVAFGAATKTVPYVMDGTKLYHFTLKFGDARDTDDADGQTIAISDIRPTDEQINAALPAFRGEILQIPPAYSAIKVAGERAYDMAREGRAPVLEPRPAVPYISYTLATLCPSKDTPAWAWPTCTWSTGPRRRSARWCRSPRPRSCRTGPTAW